MSARHLAIAVLCGLSLPLGSGCTGPPAELAWEPLVVERSEGDCDAKAPCARVRLEYPRFLAGADDAVLGTLDSVARTWLLVGSGAATPDTPDQVAEGFLAEYRRARREFPDAASTANWYLDRRISVLYAGPRVVSFKREHESFAGGAHGMETAEYATHDLRDGRRLTLDALVAAENLPRLDVVAEEFFRRARGLPDDVGLDEAGFWFDDGFAVNDNFAITVEGLIFHYNPYEVAPYAMGSTEILLPWETVAPLLRPDGPAADAARPWA
jgi:hypothetical protein